MKIEIKGSIVLNDGKQIGSIDGETCTLSAPVNSGPLKGAIRKAAGNPTLAFVLASKGAGNSEAKPLKLDALSDDDLAAEMKRRGLIQDVPEAPKLEQPPVKQVDLSAVERLHNLAKDGKIPHPPAKHPAMGDKTPDYVAWFKTYATADEIAMRYPENRRIAVSTAEFEAAEAKLRGKLPGEKKDTNKANDFIDKTEE